MVASGPLVGIKVLEFTQIIAGPAGCQHLADLGADVIKVEPPEGEPWRLSQQFIPLESKTYQSLNRGKRSLAIDLGKPEAQAAIHRLVPTVDVVVINYRPDVAARLHIDYETLSALKPDLIYLDSTAFGRKGPWAQSPGYDIVVQAASGMTAAVGKVDEGGVPLVGPAVADYTTGYAIALGVVSGLFHKARTGEGQLIETSLMANALTLQGTSFMSLPVADALSRGAFLEELRQARESGTSYAEVITKRRLIQQAANPGNIYYRNYLTADGAIAVGNLSAALRQKMRDALGIEYDPRDMDPEYNPRDRKYIDLAMEMVAKVEAMIRAKPSQHWLDLFAKFGVPSAPFQFVEELDVHPQVVENEYVVELEHELAGPQKMAAPPIKMSKSPPKAQGASPVLGKHTDEVLSAVGYSAEELAALREAGIIR
jgi:formyl-CoA transferase